MVVITARALQMPTTAVWAHRPVAPRSSAPAPTGVACRSALGPGVLMIAPGCPSPRSVDSLPSGAVQARLIARGLWAALRCASHRKQ